MNKLLIFLLASLLGCNASSPEDGDRNRQNANPPPAGDAASVVHSVFPVPRPSSGKFSTEEAAALLPQFLQRSTPVQKTAAIATQWESPTQGIRIHLTADDKVEIVDYLGRKLTGVDSIEGALGSTMTDGNERSVLLTSEVAGWESPTKKAVLAILFQPSVQIYLVGNRDG